ncbi:MAG TPA: NUDIX domain-containing protein [Chloroflexota bacterium]|nr:NUDIX domain-containing protein [Chloroflexota bacterium]
MSALPLFKHPPAMLFRLFRRLPTRVRLLIFSFVSRKVTLGVSAIVLDTQDHILLVRHTYRRPAWDYPSGLIDGNEQPPVALLREIGEELGVAATAGPLLHAENHQDTRHLTLYYRVFLHGTPRYNGTEIDDCRYVSFDELSALTGSPPTTWLLHERSLSRRATS